MGYTHYWTIKEPIDSDAWDKLRKGIQQIVGTAQDSGIDIKDESNDERIVFNGVGAGEHESFFLELGDEEFNFCKTAGKPYDTAVTASLILLKKELGDAVIIKSDGTWADWESGQLLYETVFNVAPESVFL
jgi:hypothetical protein